MVVRAIIVVLIIHSHVKKDHHQSLLLCVLEVVGVEVCPKVTIFYTMTLLCCGGKKETQ